MRSGTKFGVTFSTIVKAGRRRTVVGSDDEWSSCGGGKLEAESINFCFLMLAYEFDMKSIWISYTIAGFNATLSNRLHYTTLLI